MTSLSDSCRQFAFQFVSGLCRWRRQPEPFSDHSGELHGGLDFRAGDADDVGVAELRRNVIQQGGATATLRAVDHNHLVTKFEQMCCQIEPLLQALIDDQLGVGVHCPALVRGVPVRLFATERLIHDRPVGVRGETRV